MRETLLKPAQSFKEQVSVRYDAQSDQGFVLDDRGMAFWVGLMAVALPTICLIGVLGFPFGKVCFANSLSHFYFTRGYGDIFVGVLVFIAIYLFNFRGRGWLHNLAATGAGLGAIMVAVFPTNGVPCEALTGMDAWFYSGRFRGLIEVSGQGAAISYDAVLNQSGDLSTKLFEAKVVNLIFWQVPSTVLHFAGAGAMFLFIAWYAYTQFDSEEVSKYANSSGELKTKTQLDADIAQQKTDRRIYKRCSNLIFLAIGIILAERAARALGFGTQEYWELANGMFLMEALALYAFGYAWLHYGRFVTRAKNTKDRIVALSTGAG
ncbi:MAG: hypothetical protein AAF429_09035 [Pseudomonadota bacterium]